MGLRIEGDVVYTETTPLHYGVENSGSKSNVVVFTDAETFLKLIQSRPKIVQVRCREYSGQYIAFKRKISDISCVAEVLDKKVVVISWRQ